ncbi:MAG: xanthine dehydrogenase family protein molybdopterin-binding subunit [Chloroflexi bacterium]|nr:xanthine dehydrogenase family protein molybdopterin-binding subunit [Chloroflexota bacterium]
MTNYQTIGKAIPRLEGLDKVSGQARYTADINLPGMLWGKTLRSPYAHARILRIDASKAWQLPDVHAVLTANDIPNTLVGRRMRDMPVLARDRVRFIGEKVAAVAAENPDTAEEALSQIEVEYEDLPAVFDPLEAARDSAPLLHEEVGSYQGLPQPLDKPTNLFSTVTWKLGNLEEGIARSDLVFEHTFSVPAVHQVYLEPHACVVSIDATGQVQVWASNKAPFALRRQLAEAAEIPEESIVVHPTVIGGDFGGKGSFMDVPLCYFLAKRAGRPVKMVMTYLEELMAGNPRHPAIVTIKSGVTRDGQILARHAKLIFNSGAYAAFKPVPAVNLLGARNAGGTYRIPNLTIESHCVYTNCVPAGHMRAPGEPQAIFAVESHMDMIAHELGIDPLDFRLRNILRDGDPDPTGHPLHNVRAEETLLAAANAADWGSPKSTPHVGRGIAMSERHVGGGETTATLTLSPDGTARLLTPLLDTGTGAYLILRQVVAEVLTLPIESITIVSQDTSETRFDTGVGGSRVTHIGGQAAYRAAQYLKGKLTTLAAERLGCPEGQVLLSRGTFSVRGDQRQLTLNELAAEAPSEALSVTTTYQATQPTSGISFCAQAAEVGVDVETGQVKVRRIVSAHDVGTVLNPIAHQGQIEGGIIQGLGYALMEELQGEEGRVSTLTFGEYKVPTMKDIPEMVTVLLEPSSGPTPFQGKAIGEHTVSPIAAAITNAVFDAAGVRINSLPITAEKVYRALKERRAAEKRKG